ncbi:MAG: hypothetical protein IKH88_13955 [Prevotella sp.]|nr:hypothetical protein [Prevotella sp.]
MHISYEETIWFTGDGGDGKEKEHLAGIFASEKGQKTVKHKNDYNNEKDNDFGRPLLGNGRQCYN